MKNIKYVMAETGDEITTGFKSLVSNNEKTAKVCGNKIIAGEKGDALIYAVHGAKKRLAYHITVGHERQNPVLPRSWEMYIPDGEPHEFDGKMYVYGSLDGYTKGFCSPYYASLYSEDLIRWESGGYSFSSMQRGIPGRGRSLWAPDCCRHNGRYYMYSWFEPDFGRQVHEETMFVVDSGKPTGRFGNFRDITDSKTGGKIRGGDPAVFCENGERYLLWGTPHTDPQIGRLIDGCTIEHDSVKGLIEYLPDFFEGVSLRKRGEYYYLIYAQNCGPVTPQNRTPKRFAYAMGKSLFGPYEYRGVFLSNEDYPGAVNIHGSITEFKNKWYVFYHMPEDGVFNKRSLCISEINFDDKGGIIPVRDWAKV